MTWGAVAVAGAGLVGGMMSANAASDAADQQSQSSQQAIMAQQAAIDQMRKDLSPWSTAGAGAQTALNQYLGIGGAGSSGVTSMGLSTGLSPDQVRQQLLSRYTRTSTPSASGANPLNLPPPTSPIDAYNQLVQYGQYAGTHPSGGVGSDGQPYGVGQGPGYWEPGSIGTGADEAGKSQRWVSTAGQQGNTSTVDEEGLNAAIAKYYEEANAQNAAAQADPRYGSLLQAFHGGAEFDSGPAYDAGPAFSFTGADLKNDPGYQFGLDQGTQGIDRGQASRGNFLSGAAMKQLARFNEDYAGTKFNEGFNRASNTYNTNQSTNLNEYNTNLSRRQNEWNTNLGAYNQNRNTIYDFLTGVSRTGQNSAAQVGTSNNRAADNTGNYLTNAGTAQSAATVAGGNAIQSALNSGVNSYNTSQNGSNLNSAAGWNTLLAGNGGGYSGYTGYVGNPSTNDTLGNFISSKNY